MDWHVYHIHKIAGRIYLAKGELDRETLDSYIISVSAFSSNQEAAKILGTVTVAVLDTNDNKPTFSQVQRGRLKKKYLNIFHAHCPQWMAYIYSVYFITSFCCCWRKFYSPIDGLGRESFHWLTFCIRYVIIFLIQSNIIIYDPAVLSRT